MKHTHLIWFWYTRGCPPCKVRQLRYGFRLDPEGYARAVEHVIYNRYNLFTPVQRRWILEQIREI